MWELAVKYPIETTGTMVTLLPIMAFIFRMAYANRAMRFFFIYLVTKFLMEFLMFYFASEGMNNLFLGNILTIAGYFLIAKMFSEVYEERKYRVILRVCSTIFVCATLIDLYRDGIVDTFRYTGMFECIFIMLFVLMYFHQVYTHPTIQNILAHPFFWLCAGLLCYFSPSIFIVPLGYYLDRWPVNQSMYIFTMIPPILETPSFLLISLGFLFNKH